MLHVGAESDKVLPVVTEMTGSLRARKKAATEAALQESALALFVEKGYDRTTIEEIVDKADVSRRTFFRYFGSKEEVIFKGTETNFEVMRRLLRERPANETELEALKHGLAAFARYLEAVKAPILEFIDVVLQSPVLRGRSAELQGRWTAAIAEELASRAALGAVDLKRRLLASVGMATLTAAIQAWYQGLEPELGQAVYNAFKPVEDGSLFA